jgi:hypothetical protein
MGVKNFPVFSIGTVTAVQHAVTGAGSEAIPTTEGGGTPKYLMVHAYGGTQTNVVLVGASVGTGVNVTLGNGFPLPVRNHGRVVLNVVGMTHIMVNVLGAADSFVQLVPLEDS